MPVIHWIIVSIMGLLVLAGFLGIVVSLAYTWFTSEPVGLHHTAQKYIDRR